MLSDDVGQIHLLYTGEGESHKDAKYDQVSHMGFGFRRLLDLLAFGFY